MFPIQTTPTSRQNDLHSRSSAFGDACTWLQETNPKQHVRERGGALPPWGAQPSRLIFSRLIQSHQSARLFISSGIQRPLQKAGVTRGTLAAEHPGGLPAAPAPRRAARCPWNGAHRLDTALPQPRGKPFWAAGLEGTGRNALLKADWVPPPPRHQEPQKSRPGTGTAPRAAALRFPRG